MREFFGALLQAAPPTPAGAGAARTLARCAVLGAFVLGLVPGGRAALAQARKSGGGGVATPKAADAGVKKAPRPEAPKAGTEKVKTESGKVDVKPIKAFLARSRRLHDQGKLDLSKPQSVVVAGDRQPDGTLTNVQIGGDSTADPAFGAVARDFVASLNESRALAVLSDVSRVQMTFTLDGERFRALTASDAPTEARAEEMARGYRMLINAGRLMKRGTDEGALLSGMKVSASGKQLLMNLDMPREQMGNILMRQITPN